MREADYYRKEPGTAVTCLLCPHHCRIRPGARGRCGVRENRAGTLYALTWRRLAACQVDPVEKKPLFHFLPGTRSLSLGTEGCNFTCLFCQNSAISQAVKQAGLQPGGFSPAPAEIAALAADRGCASISCTYNEPAVFFEYAFGIAVAAAGRGLYNIFVTNGYLEKEPLAKIAPYLHAANVDLKSFRDGFYRRLCGGRLKPVLETLERLKNGGAWLEVTTLLIPGENDSDRELSDLAGFIARNLGADTPWHISRFFPCHRFTHAPPTPAQVIKRAADIGTARGLRFVYPGNLPGNQAESTFCPDCGRRLIGRSGFAVTENNLSGGACRFCGRTIPGVFPAAGGTAAT